jgi:hypothetical protein
MTALGISSGRGRVRNPESDGRMKQNRKNAAPKRNDVVPGAQGRVKHPETDRRLKQNRDTGV